MVSFDAAAAKNDDERRRRSVGVLRARRRTTKTTTTKLFRFLLSFVVFAAVAASASSDSSTPLAVERGVATTAFFVRPLVRGRHCRRPAAIASSAFSFPRSGRTGRRRSGRTTTTTIIVPPLVGGSSAALSASSSASSPSSADAPSGSAASAAAPDRANDAEEEDRRSSRRFSDDATYRRNLEIRDLALMASRGDPDAARRAEEILVRMEEEEEERDVGDEGDDVEGGEGGGGYGSADTVSYNGVINAYAKSPKLDGAVDAERVLGRMEDAHRRQREARDDWLLRNREGEGECGKGDDGNEPKIVVKPNVRTYSTVIDAWSRRPPRQGRSATRAQSVLDRLIALHDETNDEDLKPNAVSYNSAINAWAKSGTGRDGAIRAERLLIDMERDGGISPDVVSHNAVMHAWARSGEDDAGERAESILRRMQSSRVGDDDGDDDDASVTPNARTYATAIDAWTRSASPSSALRAHRLLIDAERLYEATKNDEVKPNVVTYSSVINAYARSKASNKASVAARLLRKMIELSTTGRNADAKPTLVTYNSVLNACATSYVRRGVGGLDDESSSLDDARKSDGGNENDDEDDRSTAMSIVRAIYRELTTDDESLRNPFGLRADHFTYGTVLKACANLIDPAAHLSSSSSSSTRERETDDDDDEYEHESSETKFVRDVFSTCCREGQVSFGVCFQLRQAAPAALYRSLIPKEALDADSGRFRYEDMPREWRRNVAERGQGRKRFGSQQLGNAESD